MSIERFLRERTNKIEIIDEFKNIIISESYKKMPKYTKSKKVTTDDIIKHLLTIGNMSYISGDIYLFEHFIESLFEIININSGIINIDELLKHIYNFGIMSSHAHNINLYSIIINNIEKIIYELKEPIPINNYLYILKNLALKSEKENFDLGILEIIKTFKKINKYFINNNIQINKVYLKNILIILIYSAEKNNKEYLKNMILNEINNLITQNIK